MADLATRPVQTIPVDPFTGQPDMQAIVNALARKYEQQYGGNPSAQQQPVIAAPQSTPGLFREIPPIAGTVAMPRDVRPSSVPNGASFDQRVLDSIGSDAVATRPAVPALQADPFTGKTGLTVQQVMATPRPSNSVVKAYEGRPPPRVAGGTVDPSIPRLSPLDAPLVAQAQPFTKGGATYYPPGGDYGYNAATGNWEVKQPGQAYVSVKAPQIPAARAIEVAAPRVAGQDVALPRPRPANAPVMIAARPQTSPRPYAGVESTPSLVPHVDDKMLHAANTLATSPLAQLMAMFGGGLSKGPPQTSPFSQSASGGSLNGAHEDYQSGADYVAAAKAAGATPEQLAGLRRQYGLAA